MQFFHKVLKINSLQTEFRPNFSLWGMKTSLFSMLLVFVSLLLNGCKSESEMEKESVWSKLEANACNEGISFETMQYSKMFRLGKRCGRNVVEIRSVMGRDTLVKRFVLLDEAYSDGIATGRTWEGFTVLHVPLKRVVPLSSSQIGFMSRLGVVDHIVGVGEGKYIVDSVLHRSAARGSVVEVGNGSALSLEKLLAVKPDLVMTFATGGGEDDYERLVSVGVPLMLTSEWQEDSPLAKYEWIKLYGKLFCVAWVDSVFEQDKLSYARRLEDYSMAPDTRESSKPRVLAGMPYGGVWYAPGGKSYTAQLIHDAGGRYLWADDTTREMKLSLEEVFLLADSADVWVNPGMFASTGEMLASEPRVKGIKAIRDRRVFQNDGRRGAGGGNDFYEGAVARPVELLENLHNCFLGKKSCDSYEKKTVPYYKWYRNIYNF